MATVVPFAPTNIVANALFNLDVFGYADFKLTGTVAVSVSDSFTFDQFLAGSGQISSDIYTSLASGGGGWTAEQLANIALITDTYSNFINLSFSPVQNRSGLTPAQVGAQSDINISLIYRTDLSYAGLSSLGDDAIFGYPYARNDIVVNVNGLGPRGLNNDYSLGSVSYGFHVLMHEIGHALGMAHPHSFIINATPTLTTEYAALTALGFDKLGFAINSPLDMDREYFSIMSYDDRIPSDTGDTFAQTPMILDVIAMQSVYGEGSGSSGSGNDVVTAGGRGGVASYRTYFDTGGTDTINLENYASGAYLHMGTTIIGATHLVGVSMSAGDAEFMINSGGSPSSLRWYYGEYENAEGSAAADSLYGNTLDNLINGGNGDDIIEGSLGNDTLDGGQGEDTARFSGMRSQYTLSSTSTGWTVSGPDGTDTLAGMEFAAFADQTVSLGNYLPAGTVSIAGVASQGELLTASHTLSDANGLGNVGYQWLANGLDILGETQSTLVLSQSQVGKVITVMARYVDGHGHPESVASAPTAAVANVNDAPTAGLPGSQVLVPGQPVSLNIGQLFSDPDGDALTFFASGLPAGLAINTVSGSITGNAPAENASHQVTVTATDPHNASATLGFDLVISTDNMVTASVVTRAGLALPGVTAHEVHSLTPAGSVFAFRNLGMEGAATQTLSGDVITTGSGEGSLSLTFQAGGDAGFQGFNLNGPITDGNGWTIVTNASGNSYQLSASKLNAPIVPDTQVGQFTLVLPASATGTPILTLTHAELATSSPDRNLIYTKASMGTSGQFSTLLPDANLAISLERGTSDYLINGTSNPVTAADALDALKLSVNIPASSGNTWKELISADINKDGRVTAADALEILKVSVGISTLQPSWVFVPDQADVNPNLAGMTRTSVTYKDDLSLASITGPFTTTFTGILLGDVNNSWVIPG